MLLLFVPLDWLFYKSCHKATALNSVEVKFRIEENAGFKNEKRCDIRDFDKKLEEEVLKLTESGEVTLLMTSLLKTPCNLSG